MITVLQKNKSTFRVIPAIDIIDGKCVRLTQGDYSQKTIYNEDPLEEALKFESNGITRLHLVDLDGAKKGSIVNYKVLERIASRTKLVIDFGGGIKTNHDIQNVYDSGAAIATIGSIAVKDPSLFRSWISNYGPSRILLGADVKNKMLAINGWQQSTEVPVIDFIRENVAAGLITFFCTDIECDGLLEGPSLELYKELVLNFPDTSVIASGGVSCVKDLEELKVAGCEGVIVGKAFYEGRISMNDLQKFS